LILSLQQGERRVAELGSTCAGSELDQSYRKFPVFPAFLIHWPLAAADWDVSGERCSASPRLRGEDSGEGAPE